MPVIAGMKVESFKIVLQWALQKQVVTASVPHPEYEMAAAVAAGWVLCCISVDQVMDARQLGPGPHRPDRKQPWA